MKYLNVLISLVTVWQLAAGATARANEHLWTTISKSKQSHPLLNAAQRRVVNAYSVQFKPDRLDLTPGENGAVSMTLPLPTGELVEFEMFASSILPPGLAAKYSSIRTFSGTSVGYSRSLELELDYSPSSGIGAYIVDGGTRYYLERYIEKTQEYKVYSNHEFDKATSELQHFPKCTADSHRQVSSKNLQTELLGSNNSKQYVFTIGISTTGYYSSYHGNTIERVLPQIVRAINRVSGVYKREMGIAFQLSEETDKLICLAPCASFPYTTVSEYEIIDHVRSRGVDQDSFDLGHVFKTGDSGYAGLGSTCTSRRLVGVTGSSPPEGDKFFIDFLSHEIGHQFDAYHTFADCSRSSGQVAFEPASASTIMGYAGLCNYNVQMFSDPIFHLDNLNEMTSFVRAVTRFPDCGTTRPSETPIPRFDTKTTCRVPGNSFVQLGFADLDGGRNMYSFEYTQSTGYYSYIDKNTPRFRTWIPTRRPYRTLPNMFYIIHGLTDLVLDEILPRPNVDTTMRFRAVVRSSFDVDAFPDDPSLSTGFGSYASVNTDVAFDGAIRPLRISNTQQHLETGWTGNDVYNVTWTGGYNDDRLGLFVVKHDPAMDLNGFVFDASNPNPIDYDSQIADLPWLQIATFENTGSATVVAPFLDFGSVSSVKAHLMLRSVESNLCFYFDVLPFLTYVKPPQ